MAPGENYEPSNPYGQPPAEGTEGQPWQDAAQTPPYGQGQPYGYGQGYEPGSAQPYQGAWQQPGAYPQADPYGQAGTYAPGDAYQPYQGAYQQPGAYPQGDAYQQTAQYQPAGANPQGDPYQAGAYQQADPSQAYAGAYQQQPVGGVPPYQNVPYQDASYQAPNAGAWQQAAAPEITMSDTDRTLRLIAFIFNIISLVSACWLLIPLAWMIPMCVISWRIYKGTDPNTLAFGVCDLIFLSVVGGILLLCSTKDIRD